MIKEATASAHCSSETVQHCDNSGESADGTLSAIDNLSTIIKPVQSYMFDAVSTH